jgi:hypothetical protein
MQVVIIILSVAQNKQHTNLQKNDKNTTTEHHSAIEPTVLTHFTSFILKISAYH